LPPIRRFRSQPEELPADPWTVTTRSFAFIRATVVLVIPVSIDSFVPAEANPDVRRVDTGERSVVDEPEESG